VSDQPLNIEPAMWQHLNDEKRRLLATTGLTVEEKLRRGQKLSAQAAALRRSIVRDESQPRRP
jgi:hypothetical protein